MSGGQLSHIPGKRGLPFLGILPEAVIDPLAFASRMHERFGPVHRFRACGSWNVQLVGPEANEFVLFDSQGNFSCEGGWRPVFGRHFDGGLLLRDGEDHRWHRKAIAGAFKQERLADYLRMFARNIEAKLRRCSGRTVNLHRFAQQAGFASGYEVFLGRDPATSQERDLLAFRFLMQSSTAVLTFPLPGSCEGRARWARRHVERLIRPMLGQPAGGGRDLLSSLLSLRDAGLLSNQEVLAHLTFVIAASFDTLSSGTTSLLYFLAANPQWQEKVRSELCDRIPDAREMDLPSVQGCELAERCFKEALRLNAAAPVLWRRSVRNCSFAGFDLPAGTITGVNPMLTHLLPSVWPDPLRFDPDRFLPERTRERHRFAFVPFGGGLHACLGANYASIQVRALLRLLLESHDLRLVGDKKPRWHHWPNCTPRRPLLIEFASRQASTSE